MAAKVIWSPQAHDDLRLIVAYVRQGGSLVARRVGGEIIAAVQSLSEFPDKGRVFRELDRVGVRELILPPYRIIYRHDPSQKVVRILRLWHSARGLPDLPRA